MNIQLKTKTRNYTIDDKLQEDYALRIPMENEVISLPSIDTIKMYVNNFVKNFTNKGGNIETLTAKTANEDGKVVHSRFSPLSWVQKFVALFLNRDFSKYLDRDLSPYVWMNFEIGNSMPVVALTDGNGKIKTIFDASRKDDKFLQVFGLDDKSIVDFMKNNVRGWIANADENEVNGKDNFKTATVGDRVYFLILSDEMTNQLFNSVKYISDIAPYITDIKIPRMFVIKKVDNESKSTKIEEETLITETKQRRFYMKSEIKKLIESSITVKVMKETVDLDDRKEVVQEEFYKYMEGKNIVREDITITAISDMTVSFMLNGISTFVFYQNYSFNEENKTVGFDDMDMQKVEISDVAEVIPAVSEKVNLAKAIAEDIKGGKLKDASLKVEGLFEQTLAMKLKKTPDVMISESAKVIGKKIIDEALKKD